MIDIYELNIGQIVTPKMGLELARYFKLDYLIERLEKHPDKYKDFVWDGCSMIPDRLLTVFTGINWRQITYNCCMPHDCAYAYGELGNKKEKQKADFKLIDDLLTIGMLTWQVQLFYNAVEIGGAEHLKLDFSWGFANKE